MSVGIIEVLFVILAALILLAVLGGLLYIILHVWRLTKRVRTMEEQLKEMGDKE
jgi:Flp pilus assembly protein TadB